MELRFTQATRRHRLGRAHVKVVMAGDPISVVMNPRGEREYTWVGRDDRGLEIEVIAVEVVDARSGADVLLVKHAMPTALRRGRRGDSEDQSG